MSLHGRSGSGVQSLSALRSVLVSTECDEEVDSKEYEDVQLELRTTGHNLTSVLMNPRETLLDSLLDEFAAEQSAALSVSTTSSLSLSLSFFSSHTTTATSTHNRSSHSTHRHNSSTHSAHSTTHPHSTHSVTHHTTSTHNNNNNSRHNDALSLSHMSLSLTQTELDALSLFERRMSQVSKMYHTLAYTHMSTDTTTHSTQQENGSGNGNGSGNERERTRASQRRAQDDLSACYRNVPHLFFSPSFSLRDERHFLEAMLGSDAHTLALSQALAHNATTQQPPTTTTTTAHTRAPHNALTQLRTTEKVRPVVTENREDTISAEELQRENALLEIFRSTHEDQDVALSLRLDEVEVALLRQIWFRAPAFLKALEDLQGLQHDVYEATKRLTRLRRALSQSITQVAHTLSIPRLQRRVQHETALWHAVHGMQRAVQGRALALSLFAAEDYLSAQEVLQEVRRAFREDELHKIESMRNIGESLAEMDAAVQEVLCARFVSTAIEWEDDSLATQLSLTTLSDSGSLGSTSEGLGGFGELDGVFENLGVGPAATSSTSSVVERDRESRSTDLCALLTALHRGETLSATLSVAYRERLSDALRLAVRTCVTEFVGAEDSLSVSLSQSEGPHIAPTQPALTTPSSSSHVQRVRSLSVSQFAQCLSLCCESALWALRRASAFHAALTALLTTQRALTTNIDRETDRKRDDDNARMDNALPSTEQDIESDNDTLPAMPSMTCAQGAHYLALSQHTLVAATEVAQKTIAQLLNSRREATAKSDIAQMSAFWRVTLAFLQEIERVSGGTALQLLQALLRQSRAFIEELHSANKQRLVNSLEHERWTQCDVSRERQREIESLARGRAALSLSSTQQGIESGSVSSVNTVSGVKETRGVCVDGEEFRVVWSALLAVEVCAAMVTVARAFPLLASDCVARIAESLSLFSQRTRKLVLGAQAIQSAARLKSISAKHLALTSQSLSLLLTLLPHFRTALLAVLPPKHHMLLAELDRVAQELLSHHADITSKFVSIVSDVIDHAATRLSLTTQTTSPSPPPTPSTSSSTVNTPKTTGSGVVGSGSGVGKDCVSEYCDEIVRNVSTLHKVLSALLPAREIADVFSRIFALLSRKLPAHFADMLSPPPQQTNTQQHTQTQTQTALSPQMQALWRQRVCDETQHVVLSLCRLKGVDGSVLTTQLEDTLRVKLGVMSDASSSQSVRPPLTESERVVESCVESASAR